MTAKTKTQITSEISTLLLDNTTGLITPAALRTVVQDIVDSYLDALSNSVLVNGDTWVGNASGVAVATKTFTATMTFSGNPNYIITGTGTVNVSNVASNTVQYQGQGNSATTAIHLNPGSGTLSTGTITEFVSERTSTQAFGGNYGRWSYTNLGAAQANQSGIFGEFGGTTPVGNYLLQVGIENPPSVFTTYFGWTFVALDGGAEDVQIGAIQFPGRPTNDTFNKIALLQNSIGSAGQRDSTAVLWEGKANNGTERAVWWRQFVDVTSNAGASTFQVQRNLNGAGWSNVLGITDTSILNITGTGSGVISLQPQAAAGTFNWNWPITAGAAGTMLQSGGGSAAAMTWGFTQMIGGFAASVNFNSGNTDTAITLVIPSTNWQLIAVSISGASVDISTATWGLFSTTGGGGTALFAAGQAVTVVTAAANTNNNMQFTIPATGNTESFNFTSVQFRIGTAEGVAATAHVHIWVRPLP